MTKALLMVITCAACVTVWVPKANAQSQTYGSYLKLCNRTPGPISGSYTLRDLPQSKAISVFLAPGACDTVSLSGYTGRVTITGEEVGQSEVSFSSVDATPAAGGMLLATFSPTCPAATGQSASVCLQPQH
jgi:hypothetical protein